MAAPVSIVIPAFNELDYCRQCLNALLAHTRGEYRLILVDNGSTDGVGDFFDAIPGACVIHAGSNKGFSGGVNLGLAYAEGHVVLLNSDTLVPEGWLERLTAALECSSNIGMVGPMSNCVSGPQLIEGLSFDSLDAINAYARDLAERRQGALTETDRLVGFCLMIRDTVVRDVGLFDEAFGIGNFEDDDYCVRVRAAGYKLCIAEDAFVFHYGSRTFLGMGITDAAWRDLIDTNEDLFRRKWNAAPPDRTSAEADSRQLNATAKRAFEAGNLKQAVRLYSKAIETFPLLDTNYNDLGAVLWNMGEHERARHYFECAIRLNPANTEARENLRDAQASRDVRKATTRE